MSSNETDTVSTALLTVVLLVVAVVVIGGLAMVGMMGFGMMGSGMMGGSIGWGWLLVLAPVVVIALFLLLMPGLWTRRAEQAPYAPLPPAYPQMPPVQQAPPVDAAIAILEQRLATGEITEQQFRSALETIRSGRTP